ncbi:hypothetical protein Tco_0310934, partial [Tanacetum coccineum]
MIHLLNRKIVGEEIIGGAECIHRPPWFYIGEDAQHVVADSFEYVFHLPRILAGVGDLTQRSLDGEADVMHWKHNHSRKRVYDLESESVAGH